MDRGATDQLATLEFALRALRDQVVALQTSRWTPCRTASRGRFAGWRATR